MMSCSDVSELVSKSMGERLVRRERWAVKMHLMLCKMCRRYAAQLRFLQKITGRHEACAVEEKCNVKLSAHARQRIQREIDLHVGIDSH